jgi:hypothetical protein
LQSHQQCEPTPKGKREHISSDNRPQAGPLHVAILCENRLGQYPNCRSRWCSTSKIPELILGRRVSDRRKFDRRT